MQAFLPHTHALPCHHFNHWTVVYSWLINSRKCICSYLVRSSYLEKIMTRHLADNMYLTVCWKFLEALSDMSKQRGGREERGIHEYIAHSVGHGLSLRLFWINLYYSLMVKSAVFSTHKCQNSQFSQNVGNNIKWLMFPITAVMQW